IHFRVRVIVARSYFTLSKLLKEPTTLSKTTEDMVAGILRGEKPARSDFILAVSTTDFGQGDMIEYHVHSAPFSRLGK
ncbi:hypothetical protein PMAYCL1PPCAC_00621, partial [Pristionchus mayeri]